MKITISSQNQAIDLKKRYQTVLKFLFTAFLMFCSMGVWGQTTIYSENMGTPTATSMIAANTFQNSSPIAYSGTGDVRNTSESKGYTGASGGGNILLTNNGTSNFIVSGISTINFTGLSLSFGALKSTTASTMSELKLEYSTDGTNYAVLAIPAQAAGSGTAIWRLISSISLPAAAENVPNLHLKWTNTSSTPQFRLDDVVLKGTAPTGYNVTYNGNANTSGSVPSDNSNYSSGATVTVLGNTGTLGKTSYNFDGWNTLGTGLGTDRTVGSTFSITANTILYAKWTGKVSYDANGGTGTITDATKYLAGASVATAASSGFTRSGYTFSSWNTAADGSGTNYAASTASALTFYGNITLYAKWTSSYSISYANLQSPATANFVEGGNFTFYGRVYASGLTDTVPPASTGIIAEFGYSSTNNNPNLAGWTWVAASYNAEYVNDDEYKATVGAGIAPGTYYYATRFKIGSSGAWVYGGYTSGGGGIWGGSNVSGVLTVTANRVNWANIQSPISGTITEGTAYNVYSQVNKPGVTGNSGSHIEITGWIGYSNANTNPSGSGWTWIAASKNPAYIDDSNDEYVADIGTGRTADTYYYASRYQMSGSLTYFYGGHAGGPNTGGEWGNPVANISGVLTIKSKPAINVKQGTTSIATGGNFDFGNQISGTSSASTTFTIENTGQTNLTVSNPTKFGANAADFTVSSVVSTTVTGGSSTTFTIVFSPTTLGAKTAELSISNNDLTKNPYLINLTGTGTASAESHVFVDTGFTYPQNILYVNYVDNSHTITLTNSIEVARFIVSDGAVGTGDADNLPTNINSLSFGVTNASNLDKIALYDGATKLGEVNGGATPIGFGGFILTIPDNTSKTLSIRVLFNTAVTDNERIIFSGGLRTAQNTGSTFVVSDAPQKTSENGNDNLIEVVADRLAFTTQPTNTGVNVTMSNVVVSASDLYNNIDLDLAGSSVSLTSTGTMTGTPLSANFSAGKATFTGITHTVTGTGFTLTATTSGLASSNTATSTGFDITEINYVNGDYRSTTTGLWNPDVPQTSAYAKWDRKTASGWDLDVSPPARNTSNAIYIQHGTVVTSGNSYGNNVKIYVLSGGEFIHQHNSTANTIYIYNGGIFEFKSNLLRINTLFEIEDGGTFLYNYAANPGSSIALWYGKEIFHPDSNFIVQDHDSGSTKYFLPADGTTIGSSQISPSTFNGETAYFGNLVFKKDAKITTNNLNNKTLTHGNLEFKLPANTSLIDGNLTWTIGKNLVFDSSNNGNVTTTTGGNTITINVKGDIINNSAKNFILVNNNNGNVILNVDGNINLTAGILDLNYTNGGKGTINLKGNLFVDNAAKLHANSTTISNTNFNFNGNSLQTIDISNQATASNILFKVNPNASAKLVNNNLDLGTASTLTVNGIFDSNDKLLKGTTGTQTVTVNSGGTFITANTNGFSGSATNTSVLTSVENIDLKTGSTVEYSGANQTVTHQTNIGQGTDGNYSNLKISGTGIKTATGTTVVKNVTTVASAELLVPETANDDPVNAFWASKGLTVNTGAAFRLANNANLLQDANVTNTGNITQERKAIVPNDQYNYWSSPVKSQELYTLYPGVPYNKVMVYNTATDFFTVLPKSSNPLSEFAKGYSIKGSTNATYAPNLIATFVGVPNNETTGGNTITLLKAGNNYNLIGNPFPSNLNLKELYSDTSNKSKFYDDGTSETPTAYLWDNTSNTDLTQIGSGYAQNNYALVNLSTGIGTPAPRVGATKKPNGIIRPGQGFIMRTANGGDLTFKNALMRTSAIAMDGTNSQYYKGTAQNNDKFWLQLTTPNNMNIVIALAYNPEAEDSFERFDSAIISDAVSENLYSLSSDSKKLAIQSRKGDFSDTDKISLGIKTAKTGTQKISIDEKLGVFENQPIYLKDNLLNMITDLSASAYDFTNSPGVDHNRFEIVFKPSGTLVTTNQQKGILKVYRSGEYFVVKSNDAKIEEVEVYDAVGSLYQKVKGGTVEVKIDAAPLTNGLYVLKIKRNNETISKKIIK